MSIRRSKNLKQDRLKVGKARLGFSGVERAYILLYETTPRGIPAYSRSLYTCQYLN